MSCEMARNDLGAHICVKLINLVKHHPIIYVSPKELSVRPRNKRNQVNEIWDNIALDIGLTAEDCKRRWKALKDVYAKICKRRLQEGVLGIKPRKKWLYEKDMSFMKFLFEQPYEKALENVEEVNLKEWKMDETETDDGTEELSTENVDHSESVRTQRNQASNAEGQEFESDNGTIEYLDLDLPLDYTSDPEAQEERDGGLDNTTPSGCAEVLKTGSSPSPESRILPRFRAIRPKPFHPNLLGKNSSGNIVSISILNTQSQVAASPGLGRGKNGDTIILGSLNTNVNKFGKAIGDRVSSTPPVRAREEGPCLIGRKDYAHKTSLQIALKKSSSSSVELFFKSMALSVMKLPTAIQAEIKMDICKIVTRAEIQYSLSQTRKSGRNKSR